MKSLKVLMLNGSPHTNGNTAVALRLLCQDRQVRL